MALRTLDAEGIVIEVADHRVGNVTLHGVDALDIRRLTVRGSVDGPKRAPDHAPFPVASADADMMREAEEPPA